MTRRLFLFETRRLLRHPLVWGMAALVLALQTYLTRDQQPDLTVDPVHAAGLSTCLAAAVLVVASLAASRDGRHGMPESLAALPGRAEHRTRAVLLATALVAGLAAAVTVGGYLVVRLLSGPVAGRLDVWEPLAAVAAAVFAATLGVAVGRWARWLIAGPLVVAVLGFLTFQNPFNGAAAWWLPVMQVHEADWPDRPSAVHLLYVLALAAAFAGLALLRHRVRLTPLVAVVAALAVAVPSGATAVAEEPVVRFGAGEMTIDDVDPRVRERYFGANAHVCSARDGIRYCAYPGYEPWIPLWEAALRPVVAALPPALRGRLPAVRQTSMTWYFGHDMDTPLIMTPLSWGHPDQRTAMAQDVAFWATRLYAAAAKAFAARPRESCDARGQARTLVALWLVGQVSRPEVPRILMLNGSYGRRAGFEWGAAEVGYAERLLAAPHARERVLAHWDTLVQPATTIEQALPLLGLEKGPAAPTGARPCP